MDNAALERGKAIQKELFNAARTGNIEVLSLFASDAPELLGAKDERGFTPLIMAAYYDQLEAVKFLIKAGVNVNAQDDAGNTALMGVAFKNYEAIAKCLVEAGCDARIANYGGKTALDFANMFGNSNLAALLS